MRRCSPRLPSLVAVVLAAAIALPITLQAAPSGRAPVVTGDARVGATLTASVATPAARGTKYLFQWQTQKKVIVKKKTVTRWVAIAGAGAATFTPSPALTGASVRA
jgi:predicted Zn-dependent protease